MVCALGWVCHRGLKFQAQNALANKRFQKTLPGTLFSPVIVSHCYIASNFLCKCQIFTGAISIHIFVIRENKKYVWVHSKKNLKHLLLQKRTNGAKGLVHQKIQRKQKIQVLFNTCRFEAAHQT